MNNNSNMMNINNIPNNAQNITNQMNFSNTCYYQSNNNPLVHTMHFNPSIDFQYINNSTENQLKELFQINNINNQSDGNNNNKMLYTFITLFLNIIYYDENLLNKENSLNCAFFKLKIKGTFYGCHNFQLLKYILKNVKNSKKDFVLISSGKSANQIFNYCSDTPEIKYYFIYCNNINNYMNLKQSYHQLLGIYNNFNYLIGGLLSIPSIQNPPIISANFFFLEDYNKIYIKLHYEIIKKYFLYKLLKSQNGKMSLELIEKKYPYYLNLAEELINHDKKEIKEFFKKNTSENEELIEDVFNSSHNIRNYIKYYTYESFYYKYINLFLRQGDLDTFKILSSHISKFIYHLYEYRKNHMQIQDTSVLFRSMYISPEEFNIYENNINKIICYPSFTSTSIIENAFNPIKNSPNDQYVKLIIQQNNSKV